MHEYLWLFAAEQQEGKQQSSELAWYNKEWHLPKQMSTHKAIMWTADIICSLFSHATITGTQRKAASPVPQQHRFKPQVYERKMQQSCISRVAVHSMLSFQRQRA